MTGAQAEVCLQGGIHPDYTGDTYLEICGAVRQALPDIHIHAFSPLEIWQGAKTLGLDLETYLSRLKAAGLNTLPGTAAEILDDEVRAVLCPDKIDSGQWFEVMAAAHAVGLKATSTIMFGHVDTYTHWARHLLKLRDMQERTRCLYRVRATALRRRTIADLPETPVSVGAERARGRFDARGRAYRAGRVVPQHSDLLGEDGPRRGRALPAVGGQRSWRNLDV